jgi:hypothetical protein
MPRLLCLAPTWTLGPSLAIASVAAITSSACNFSDFSKTSPPSRFLTPACPSSNGSAPDAAASDHLIAHWSFDDEPSPASTWLDSLGQFPLLLNPDSARPIPAATRLNGRGHALYLDGKSYAANDSSDSALLPKTPEFTVSAWVSIRLEDFDAQPSSSQHIWPIVSTVGSAGCGGYQLDLRSIQSVDGPALAFTYDTTPDGDAGDCTHTLEIPLKRPSWAWGNGRWHHVVATYKQLEHDQVERDQVTLALYFDGELLLKDTPVSSVYEGTIAYSDQDTVFYVGSNGRSTNDSNSSFKGHIDDVALFDKSLSASEISALNLTQSTIPGPSNCRWNALDEWDFDAASSASWSQDSTESVAKLQVNDRYWGAAFLSARLLPERNLSWFDTAYLTADVPPRTNSPPRMFQFSISSGDDSCTWMLRANGPDRYVIDLRRPSFCASASCSFKPSNVQWARVSSDWAHSEGSFDISVSRLEFDTTQDASVANLPLGGAMGPQGWCWRPQAYDLDSLATWAGTTAPSADSVSVEMTGINPSTVRIVADLGDQLLDLSRCQKAQFDADLPDVGATTLFNFALLDANGATRNWNFTHGANSVVIDKSVVTPSYDSSTSGEALFADVPPFDITRVRLMGIDKPYQYQRSGPLTVTIRGVTFLGEDGRQGCAVPTRR